MELITKMLKTMKALNKKIQKSKKFLKLKKLKDKILKMKIRNVN